MSSLDINIPHKLPQAEALSRVKKMLTNLQAEQKDTIKNVKEEWNDNEGKFSFSAKGFDIAGNIHVGADRVSLTGELPFMLSFFKGKITEVIKEKATALLKP